MPASKAPTSAPASKALAARRSALAILQAVLIDGHRLDGALGANSAFGRLEPRDRAFVRLLLATTLRRLPELDALIGTRLKKPIAASASMVHDILRLGTAQMVFLDTPPHAAVDTAVALARRLGFDGFAGLINAVLRKLAESRPLEGAAAARMNTPDWLLESWQRDHGEDTALAIAAAHLVEPPLDLTVRHALDRNAPGKSALPDTERLPTGSLRLWRAGAVEKLPGFTEGAWWVQDAAAALPARLLGNPRGKTVLDLCAAPGGKTAQLAAAGARVTALDRSPARLQLLRNNLGRLGLTAECVEADLREWTPDRRFDAVLLDAPCSATGTIRRHPDIPHLRTAKEIDALSRTQAEMLRAAAGLVEPEGCLVYAVCSLQNAEGPEVVEALLAETSGLQRRPIEAAELSGQNVFITPAGDLRTLPCHWPEYGGLDGFYAAKLVTDA